MGWFDKLVATAGEAKKVAKELTEAVVEEAEGAWGDQDWYKETKSAGKGIGQIGKDIWEGTSEIAGELAEEVGQTEIGKQVGQTSRSVLGFLAKVPVLSAAVDIMRARHGVDELYARLVAEPHEPIHHIWLAEAMERVDTDRRRYVGVRTALDPSYIVTRQAIKATADLGSEKAESVHRRLLRNAFALSIKRLNKDPKDCQTLDIVARVYLAEGHLGEAVRFAKLATLAEPEMGLPLVTLGRAYQALKQPENAKKAAELAVRRGCSLGHEVLAELVLSGDEGTAGERIDAYSEMRAKVLKRDREAYWGPAAEGVDIVEAVGAAQLKKTTDLIDKIF